MQDEDKTKEEFINQLNKISGERHNARIDIDTCSTGTIFNVRFKV